MAISIRDKMNLVSKMTGRKIWNATKVVGSYYYSKWTKNPINWGNPLSISIEPTTACNLGCPECPSGLKKFTRDTGNLKEDFFQDTIDQMSRDLMYLIFYFQGEPYINPKFLEMVNYAHKKGIYTATSTNAHFLNDDAARKTVESGLDRLIISIDGTTQETYESYRIHGTLDKVIEGTKNVLKWKKKLKSKTPHVIFQFLVVKHNEHQIPEVKKLGKELGVDEVRLKTAQIYDFEDGNELIPTIDKYSRYKKQANGKYVIKNELLNHCWKLWQGCVITWDGLVVPCCFDKDAKHQLGDLKTQSFKELWNSERYRNFRSAVLRSRDEIDICKNCTEGTKVWA
ncbi:MAG: SPASM domain-containing protein [Bacteroidetes bacterium]|nr:SPASM domain-containing protein [Bacteroidota bacterium]